MVELTWPEPLVHLRSFFLCISNGERDVLYSWRGRDWTGTSHVTSIHGEDMVFDILIFSVIFWSGLHLVSRDPRNLRLLLAGLSLVSYALGLGSSILSSYVSAPALAVMIARLCWILFTAPAPVVPVPLISWW